MKIALALVVALLFGGAAGCASNGHNGHDSTPKESHACTGCKCTAYNGPANGTCACGCPATAHGYPSTSGSGY